jgi:hypothetical protein
VRRRKAQNTKGGHKEYNSTSKSKQCALRMERRKLRRQRKRDGRIMLYPKGSQNAGTQRIHAATRSPKAWWVARTHTMVIRLPASSTNTRRNKINGNAKFAVTPYRCSAVLVKYSTQRFHRELGRTREPIRKKFSLNIQTPSVTRRNKVVRTEERQNSALLHTMVECNQKLCRRRL